MGGIKHGSRHVIGNSSSVFPAGVFHKQLRQLAGRDASLHEVI